MRESDLDAVMAIELRAYPWPWTRGNFRDCLRAGYPMWVLEDEAAGRVTGYAVLSVQAGEAHLLNLCIDPDWQSRGQGRRLLRAMCAVVRQQAAVRVFLEVRPSNAHAIALYHGEGFNEIGRRPRYYPAAAGAREDALVMAMELLD
ncbi:ribosomal-protein-alanine N-acetyltransferase [Lysobacter pythonis]|uniref:[Ribosomal protein bS18]-alanine N-acetyltransferase n=2 Tax=Solilutibacter pythonis TaxID=2483112 RepID=A0A3M2HZ09_9GAMM|nr:ribosomal protein S18-alanine N-acetyltransferase [Lysobacter pythonis]RMH93435.1 ribosomal-protein-alanine N-acetyltransferase [Lysobacter pythonis]